MAAALLLLLVLLLFVLLVLLLRHHHNPLPLASSSSSSSSSTSSSSLSSSSSSSAAAGSGNSYEVFLSFHGEDVRTNFADHLYNALVFAGIRTFRDENELQKGNEIAPELIAAVQQSRISIPIISENYPKSKWCLKELTEIDECRRTKDQMLLPIFHKVEPRDVRNQTGIYEKVFKEHQKRFDVTTVQKWKEALKEVGVVDGWHSKNHPYEGKLIKEVVETVWSKLNKRPLIVSNNLIGIQSHIKEMLTRLDIESDGRKIVGIHGLGGVGKTTIARAVYNTIFHHFEGYSFIEDIRENARKLGLPHLQKQLIFDILKQENQNITNVDTGINVIQQRLCKKRVLIVLDDVDQDNQVKSLVGDCEWFGIGSKVIITSRNKETLIAPKTNGIYEPSMMDLNDSLKLFSHHAFGRDWPLEGYLDLSKDIVKTTGGLPLAIQVIGSSLYLKGKSIWVEMLKKVQKVPHNDVMERLKISYDGLDNEEQQMFLDTACFFIGVNKDIACHAWVGCGFSPQLGLDALGVRSLVTISEDGELRMHDHLRDLGREIVRRESEDEPGERSRIWSQEDVLEILDEQTGTIKVKLLSIDVNEKSMSRCLKSEGFAEMKKLRLLQINYAEISGNFTNSFSELRWLSWKGCRDLNALNNFLPRKLSVLDLSESEITEKWMGWNFIMTMAVNLKVLDLGDCHQLSRTPDLSANRHLEVLILRHCKHLLEIDTSIGFLKNLVTLDLSCCGRLEELPIEICHLTSLESLDLSNCQGLKKLPKKLGSMISLTTLKLGWCRKLLELPNEICQLISLESLDLQRCNTIMELPEKLGDLISLTSLKVSGCCKTVVDLPMLSSLKNLKELWLECLEKLQHISNLPSSLTSLNVYDCSSIVYISGLPSSLTSLQVCYCKSMEKLSISSSGGLRNLEELSLEYCKRLEEIEGVDGADGEGLDSLVEFYLKEIPWKKLPNLSNAKKLRVLIIFKCKILSKIGSLEGCESLETLSVDGDRSLKVLPEDVSTLKNLREFEIHSDLSSLVRLPDLPNLNKLKILLIFSCEESTTIPISFDRLESLQELTIGACDFERLPDLQNLKILTELKIVYCKKLTEIHGVDRLESLVKLYIDECESLERLPDLSSLKKLQKLRAIDCKKLTEIQAVNGLESLVKLYICGCESLERLLDLSSLKKLQKLYAKDCKKLTEIEAVNGLESLVVLDISRCESLERLPNLSNLKKLKELTVTDCKKLTEIEAVNGLESLYWLDISGYESLERLPDLSSLKKLQKLYAKDCKKLTEIQAVNGLESLEFLDVSGCISLQKLPDLSNFEKDPEQDDDSYDSDRGSTGIACDESDERVVRESNPSRIAGIYRRRR